MNTIWENIGIALFIIVILHLILYVIAYKKQTDKLTDITYSLSFGGIAAALFFMFGDYNLPGILLLIMVVIWSIRLGVFLFNRVHKLGRDARFDKIRINKKRFLIFWLLQAFSIIIVALPFMIALQKPMLEMGWIQWIGFGIWILGFYLESVADHQKSKYHSQEVKERPYIDYGLYSKIRYPNYLGEILCWVGIFVFVVPVLNGIEWISIISPIWIIILLLFISGVPKLEKANKEKHKNSEAYSKYLENSYKLIPGVY